MAPNPLIPCNVHSNSALVITPNLNLRQSRGDGQYVCDKNDIHTREASYGVVKERKCNKRVGGMSYMGK
jgi:hypothetical protein